MPLVAPLPEEFLSLDVLLPPAARTDAPRRGSRSCRQTACRGSCKKHELLRESWNGDAESLRAHPAIAGGAKWIATRNAGTGRQQLDRILFDVTIRVRADQQQPETGGLVVHTLGPVLGGMVLYPMNSAAGLLQTYDHFLRTAPDELGAVAALGTLPDGTKSAIGLYFLAANLLLASACSRPFGHTGHLCQTRVTVMPYTALQSIVENFNPGGLRNYWKSVYLDSIPAAAVRLMVEHHNPRAVQSYRRVQSRRCREPGCGRVNSRFASQRPSCSRHHRNVAGRCRR